MKRDGVVPCRICTGRNVNTGRVMYFDMVFIVVLFSVEFLL